MDHPCYKCGHALEEGKPFCPHCGAPQIRVTAPQLAPAVSGAAPATNAEPGLEYPVIPPTSLPAGWQFSKAPSVLAAVAAAGLMFLGLYPIVAAIGAGFLSVAFSRRRGEETVMRAGAGFRLGALSGLFLFAFSAALELVAVVVMHKGSELQSELMEKVQQAAARYPGPEVQPFLDFVRSPAGFAFLVAASLIFGLVAFVALGSLGGALGAALLGKRNPRDS